MSRFTIGTRADASTTVLAIAGDLDVESTPALRWAFLEAFASGIGAVTVDLTELRLCDSVGLSTLIFGYQQAGLRGVAFNVVNAREGVAAVLEITGLTGMLTPAEGAPAKLTD